MDYGKEIKQIGILAAVLLLVWGANWLVSNDEKPPANNNLVNAHQQVEVQVQKKKPITGTWSILLPGANVTLDYTITEDRGEYFQNGKPVVMFNHANGTGFRPREPDPLGEFSVVTPAGKLELHDRDGLIVVGKKK